jgi:hypothetical protein
VFFSFQTIGMAGEAFNEFGKDILTAIKANIGGVILLLLPLILLLLFISGQINFERRKIREQSILLGLSVIFQVIAMSTLLLFGKGAYSPYDLYFHSKVPDMCGKQLGIATLTRIDLGKLMNKNEDLVLADTITLPPTAVPSKTPTSVSDVNVTLIRRRLRCRPSRRHLHRLILHQM